MSTARWRQIDQIFVDARQLPQEERTEFVTHACGADDGLRVEVMSLLAAADESGEFMTKPAMEQLAKEIGLLGWRLQPGEKVGAYTVESLLGAGGAGEVWRARDERLRRHIAIKVLLPHLSRDPDRVRRFTDEARAVGALNHPNVLAVYDVGEHLGTPFIVSECLEGETLRKRVASGPLPVEKAIMIALEVARGLAAAHARGIVHRDLKPDNVFLCSNGSVKILDFGVAKLQLPDTDDLRFETSQTLAGTVIGTASYMAPEQLKGERVDARADLFALGATLYEMLSGHRAFKAGSTIETLHAVLTTDPPDLSSGDDQVPPAISQIVKRLLAKSPDARFQSAADLVWTLERAAAAGADPTHSYRRSNQAEASVGGATRSLPRWLAWTAAATGIAILAGFAWWVAWRLPGSASQALLAQVKQFEWTLPDGVGLNSAPVVSPDGQSIVFAGTDASGTRLFLRTLDSLEPKEIHGTQDAKQPFWSPDGKSVGFFARAKLMRVALAGGAPVEVASAPDGRGGTWNRDGVIVFSPDLIGSSLSKVSQAGGPVEPVTLLDLEKGDNSHRWPVFLPDGVHFLYFVRSSTDIRRGVYLGRVDRSASKPDALLFQSESEAVFASLPGGGGALLYTANGRVEVRQFDPARLALTGDPQSLMIKAGGNTPYHPTMLSVSDEVLAFSTLSVPFGGRLGSVDRTGDDVQLAADREVQGWPRLSPDGRRLALQRIDAVRGNPDIWVKDLGRGEVRITTALESDLLPAWSPDGNRLAYVTGPPAGRAGKRNFYIAAADGTGIIRTVPCPGAYCEPTDWTHDGQLIVNVGDARAQDVWSIATEESDSSRPLLAQPFVERDARISRDGWIAYVSEESGRPEVSVRNLSASSARTVISVGGGNQPVWNRNGLELFFVDLQGRLKSVSVRHTPNGTPTLGLPVELKVPPIGVGHWGTQYDVSPDGRRVYFLEREIAPAQLPHEIGFVLGWPALLR